MTRIASSRYRAFFDESERLTAGDPLCVAGYTFRQADYKQFSRAWRDLLATALPWRSIAAMHMTDLIQGKESFDGVAIPDRAACLERAAKIICDHAMVVTGALVDQKEFEAAAGPDWPERLWRLIHDALPQGGTNDRHVVARKEAAAANRLHLRSWAPASACNRLQNARPQRGHETTTNRDDNAGRIEDGE